VAPTTAAVTVSSSTAAPRPQPGSMTSFMWPPFVRDPGSAE
jgi:hypothetical protein